MIHVELIQHRIKLSRRLVWDWRTVADNGNVITPLTKQGYENRADARAMIDVAHPGLTVRTIVKSGL